jgi:hypothetical protein
VILAGVVARHWVEGLLVGTMMAGAMLAGMGVAKFGAALRFIPDPVISSFTGGGGGEGKRRDLEAHILMRGFARPAQVPHQDAAYAESATAK